MNAGKVFQFADPAGAVKNAAQRFALKAYEEKEVEAIRRNTHRQIKALRMAGLAKPDVTRK